MSKDSHLSAKSQPSLLPQNHHPKTEQSRILANLEGGNEASSPGKANGNKLKKHTPMLVLAILLLAGSSYFLFPDSSSNTTAPASSKPAERYAQAAVTPVAEQAPIEPTQIATAQIIDDATNNRSPDTQTDKTSNMQAIMSAKPEANALSKALNPPDSDKVTVVHVDKGDKADKQDKNKTKTLASRQQKEDKKQATLSQSKSQTKPQGDSDVTLLAAIVAHNHENPPTEVKPAPKAGSIASLIKGDEADGIASNTETSPLSLKDQLLKCKKLDAQNADLCKWRVCSGNKADDPACK